MRGVCDSGTQLCRSLPFSRNRYLRDGFSAFLTYGKMGEAGSIKFSPEDR